MTELAAEDRATDTGLYVYAVVPATTDATSLTGVDDAPVELVVDGELAVAFGRIALERPPGRRRDLMAHHAVVDALAGLGPVVPVQFGSVLSDEAALLEELLTPAATRFAALLANLRGRRQFNVRVRYHEEVLLAEVVAENPDVAALREATRDLPTGVGQGERVRLGELVARAVEAKREADAWVVLDALHGHTTDQVSRRGAGVDHLLDLAVLVDDDRRAGFEDALEAVAEAMHERVRVQLVGPVAPYDFVGS